MYVNSRLQVGQGCSTLADRIVGRGSVTACRTGVVGAAEGGKKSTTFFGTSGIIRGAAVMTMRGTVFGSGSACVGGVVGSSDGCGNSIGISTSVVSGCRSASLSS